MLVRQSVNDCNVCFVKACRSNVKLFWLVSRLDTCVSAVSQVSNIFTMSQSRLVSTKSEMSRLVSCLDTSVLANVSVSEKMSSLHHWQFHRLFLQLPAVRSAKQLLVGISPRSVRWPNLDFCACCCVSCDRLELYSKIPDWRVFMIFLVYCTVLLFNCMMQLSCPPALHNIFHTPMARPHAGFGVVRIDPLRFLVGCRTRRLNWV